MLATGGESTVVPFHLLCPRRALNCDGRCTTSNVAGKLWMLTKRFLTETQEINIRDVWEFPHHRLPSVSPFEDFGVIVLLSKWLQGSSDSGSDCGLQSAWLLTVGLPEPCKAMNFYPGEGPCLASEWFHGSAFTSPSQPSTP